MVIATTTALLIKSKKKRRKTVWETSPVRIRDNNYSVGRDLRVLRGCGDHGELPWMVPDHPLILATHHIPDMPECSKGNGPLLGDFL
ncbi:hypothetical protein Sjap_024187 [Stephania japonica]|uniref:Uncharacterized protein n=1 Tax=Stephania japonica TaxID=461633 RepID=A0AAP0EF28_9MAGN